MLASRASLKVEKICKSEEEYDKLFQLHMDYTWNATDDIEKLTGCSPPCSFTEFIVKMTTRVITLRNMGLGKEGNLEGSSCASKHHPHQLVLPHNRFKPI